MLIILEGVPAVGKSVVADRLSTRLRSEFPADTVEVWRNGAPREHPLDEYVTTLLGYRPRALRRDASGEPATPHGRHIICEGWHWAEAVHSAFHGRPTYLDTALLRYIEMFLCSRGALLVHLMGDELTSREHGDEIDMMRMRSGYQAMAQMSGMPVSTHHVEEAYLVDTILSDARNAEVKASVLNGLTTYVGASHSHTLLLGNARGRGIRDPRVPCFMPYPSTCGQYLMRALAGDAHTSHPGAMGMANALDVDDVGTIVSTVMPKRIITTGNVTRHVVNQIPEIFRTVGQHVTVMHPQYARRTIEADDSAWAYGQSIVWTLKHGV
jgi:hypothetical protein